MEDNTNNNVTATGGLEPASSLEVATPAQEPTTEPTPPNPNTPPAESKKKSRKKWSVKKKILLVAVAVALLAAAFVTVVFLLPDGDLNKEFTIGDTKITSEQIDTNATAMEAFLKSNPGATFGEGNAKDIAADDLIANAVYKREAKACGNIKPTYTEMAAQVGLEDEGSEQKNKAKLESLWVDAPYNWIRVENMVYYGKLYDCLIQVKDIFSVSVTYDAPYYSVIDDAKRTQEYKAIKDRLSKEFLPMFKSKASWQDIATKVDYNTVSEQAEASFDRDDYFKKPVYAARWLKYNANLGSGEHSRYNDMPDAKIDPALGEAVSVNSAVDSLKKVGDYTGVINGQNGELLILRVESISKGKYKSYDELFDEAKKEVGYTTASVVTRDLKQKISEATSPISAVVRDGVASIDEIITPKADALSYTGNCVTQRGDIGARGPDGCYVCANHTWSVWVQFLLVGTSAGVSGQTLHFAPDGGFMDACFSTRSDSSSSYGWAEASAGCYGNGRLSWSIAVNAPYAYASGPTSGSNNVPSGGNGNHDVNYYYVYVKPSANWELAASTSITSSNFPSDSSKIDYKGSDPKLSTTNKVFKYGGDTWSSDIGITTAYEYSYGARKIRHSDGTTAYGTYTTISYVTQSSTNLSTIMNSGRTTNNSLNKTFGGGDVGQSICAQTWYAPSAHNNGETNYHNANGYWDYPDNRNTACAKVISPWTISISTAAPSSTANCLTSDKRTRPNCDIAFKHTVQEGSARVVKADDGANVNVTATVYQYMNSGNNTAKPSSGWTAVSGAGGSNAAIGESGYVINGKTNTVSINQGNVGTTICQFVRSDWSGRGSNTAKDSTPQCVYVPYNYDTVPEVNIDGRADDSVIEPGQVIKNTNGEDKNVDNQSETTLGKYDTKTKDANWQITHYVILPGGESGKSAGKSAADPCAFYKSQATGWQACEALGAGKTGVVEANAKYDALFENYIVPDSTPIGARLCFAFSVQQNVQYTNDNANHSWNHSAPKCLRVGKNPKVQTHNGGVSAPGGISSKTTDRSDSRIATNTGVFGSWSEYEAISLGKIAGFGSVAAFNNGLRAGPGGAGDIRANNQSNYSAVTFGNIKPGGGAATEEHYGNYTPSNAKSSAGDLVTYFKTIAQNSSVTTYSDADVITATNEEATYYKESGAITIASGGPLVVPIGHTAIVYNKGDITIANNIEYYNGPYTVAKDIPQLIIMTAGNIRINPNVTRVDAWLIANNTSATVAGTIFTCATGTQDVEQAVNSISNTVCNQPLTVNGPVYAEKLHMLRTYGADAVAPTNPNTPAEVFTLPSSTYLWAYYYATGKNAGYAVTKYSTDLPPRY